MIRLTSIRVLLAKADPLNLPAIAAETLHVPQKNILACRLVRRAIDARRKDTPYIVLTIDVDVQGDTTPLLQRCKQASIAPVAAPATFSALDRKPAHPPVVVGSGPAGLFAALMLAKAGAMPILLERGRDAQRRHADVAAFWAGGPLDSSSNVQFGEGGAGTFSDGKLNTGIKHPHCRTVLSSFVEHGAPEEILWQAKPHVGTDHLLRVVQSLRAEIIALGGQVLFESQVTGLDVQANRLRGIHCADAYFRTDAAVFCIGHSARDTFDMLHTAGVHMEAKPFSIGARIEHPQAMIDRAQYGAFAGHPALGAADYKLSAHLQSGRGVYTFCMCPGGQVVAAASESGGIVTNGMSLFARDGQNANSALLVDVRPEDFGTDDPLAGLRFQQKWERLAFAAVGGQYHAPAQRVEDFLKQRPSARLGGVVPTYRPGVVPADLRTCLPAFVTDAMAEGLVRFDRQLRGFAHPDAVLTGVETRSSCPLRMVRDEQGQSSIHGLYPAGEGAGYAGGIISAAVDGIRAAEHVLSSYQEREVSP